MFFGPLTIEFRGGKVEEVNENVHFLVPIGIDKHCLGNEEETYPGSRMSNTWGRL